MPISLRKNLTPAEILGLPVPENALAADTIGQYLASTLAQPLRRNTPQSIGGDTWRKVFLTALVHGNAVDGVLQNDGTLYSTHEAQTKEVIEQLLDLLSTADYSQLKVHEGPRNWYLVDTTLNKESGVRTVTDVLFGPASKREALEEKESEYSGSIWRDDTLCIQIDLPRHEIPTPS